MSSREDLYAAGTALGKAKEWQSAVHYLENSYHASQLGNVSTELWFDKTLQTRITDLIISLLPLLLL